MSAHHSTSQKTLHHGKIVTQNSSLLQILREKSQESLTGIKRSNVSSLSQHSNNHKFHTDNNNQHANHYESFSDAELAIDLNALQHSSASDICSEAQLDSEHYLHNQSTYRLNANTSRIIPHINSSGFREEPYEVEDHSTTDTPVDPNQLVDEEIVSRNSFIQSRSVTNSAQHCSSDNTPRLLPIQRNSSGNTPIKSSSSVYAVANPEVLRAQGISPPPHEVQFTPRSHQNLQLNELTERNILAINVNQPYTQNSNLSNPLSENSRKGRRSIGPHSGYSRHRDRHVVIDPQFTDSFAGDAGPDWSDKSHIKNRPPTPYQQDADSSVGAKSVTPLDKAFRPPSISDWNTPRNSGRSRFSGTSRQSDCSEKQTETTPIPEYRQESIVHVHQISKAHRSLSPQPIQRSLKESLAPADTTEPRPTVKKVYVDSPTFTKDEEEEYRFVSSRLDEFDHEAYDKQDTFRQLEMNTNSRDRNPVLSGSPLNKTEYDNIRGKKASRGFLKSDRYEDRSKEMDSYGDVGQPNRQKPGTSNRFEARNDKFQRQYSPKPVSKITSIPHPYPPDSEGITTEIEELKHESDYQRILKERIMNNNKHDNGLDISDEPKLPETEAPEADEGRDFLQDSLEYTEQDERLNGYDRDSLELSESAPIVENLSDNSLVPRDNIPEYDDWKNPPPNPFGSRTSLQSEQNLQWQQMFPANFIDENDTAKMELLHPREPKINFVETNKFDYGKPQGKSYQQINERRRTDEDNLENLFIKPKVTKPRIPKSLSKGRPSQNIQVTSPLLEESLPLDYKLTSVEEYWAKRSAFLSKKKNSGKSGKSSGSVRKGVSGGNIPIQNEMSPQLFTVGSPRFQHLDPLYEQRPLVLPPPMVQQNEPVSPILYRKPLELKPITQEIITEDGQRISVDINLKVLSPPLASRMAMSMENQPFQIDSEGGPRPIGLQYQQYAPPFQQVQQYEHHAFPYYQDTQEPYMYRDLDPAGGQYQPRENGQADVYDSSKPPSTNPYAKIPPITASDNTSEISDIEGGYAANFKKQRDKYTDGSPHYKAYNLDDYKKMKRECQLGSGTLGPDLDNFSYREKLEKRHKQFEYARMVMEKNKLEYTDKRCSSSPKSKSHTSESTKRKVALEYARDIPKPSVKPRPSQYNSYEVAAQLTPASKTGRPTRSPNSVDVIDLQKLQERHEHEKQNVAMIRQNMSGPVPQKA